MSERIIRETFFRCLNCKVMISNLALGTQHRNHCPLCLYSQHVDLKVPGDREADCKSKMKPIGLVLKNQKYNPFTQRTSGELMIVHHCLKCGRLSRNRIAGDDDSDSILALLENPDQKKAKMLTQDDRKQVLAALFGYNHLEN